MTNEEAKRILQFCICIPMKTDEQREAFNLAIKALEERPQGEWIVDGHHRRCNYCSEYTCTEDKEGNSIPDSFCPNCGADMRKEGAE